MVVDTNARDFPLKAKWSPDFSVASGLAVYTESELSSLAFKAASALDLNAVKIHGFPIDNPSSTTDGYVLSWDLTTSTLEWIEVTATGGSGGAPSGAGYIVSAAHAGLTSENILNASGGLQLAYAGGSATLSIVDSGVTEGKVNDGAITNAKIRDAAAVSVLGRSANSTGDVADIEAGSNNTFLSRKSDVVGFNTIQTADLPYSPAPASAIYITSGADSILSNERILNASAGLQLQYTSTQATFSVSDLGITSGKIANQAVTNGKIRNAVGVSVLGRSANSTGSVADIAAGADRTFLSRKSSTVGFNVIETADLPYTPAPASAIYVVSGTDALLSNERSLNSSGGVVLQYNSTQATLSLSSTIDANGTLEIQDSGGGTVGTRRKLRFIQGNNINLLFNDTGDTIEVTIESMV